MNVSFENHGHYLVIRLNGVVDSVVAADLEKSLLAILKDHTEHLIVDCADLQYINSAGLRVFLLMAKQTQTQQVLAFCNLSKEVHLVFTTIGFDRILNLHATLSEAVEATALANV